MRRSDALWMCACVGVLLIVGALSPRTSEATPLRVAAIKQLTNNPATDVRPAWSPDGRQIAFQTNRDGSFDIYLMNADGSNQRALTKDKADERHPVWTFDGRTILYDASDGAEREIWSVNVADGSRKQLTRLGGLANFAAPSPDGQRMVFYLYKDDSLDLWSARIDGGDAKPLTRRLASAQQNQCTFACHQAAWSADSKLLAYSGGDHHSIWTMLANGTNAQQLIGDEEHNHFPWFMPDGRLGYITEYVSSSQAWTAARAYDFKTGARTELLSQMSVQGPFEWNGDHTKVLFHSPRTGNFDIYLVDLNAAGGVAALQGTPVPMDRMGDSTPSDAAPAPAVAAQAESPSYLVWIVVAVVLGALIIVALAMIAAVRGRRAW